MKISKLFQLLVLTFISTSAFATHCVGKVNEVAISSGGEVRLITDFRKSYFTICKVDGSWNEIATTTCMVWFSQAELAYKNQTNLKIMYPEGIDCNEFPHYGDAPKPGWIINIQ